MNNNINNNNKNNINNNNNNNNEDKVIHSGFLTKQGGNIQNWKIRWFVLKKGTLSYYISPINWETSKPRGVIYLTKRTEVKESLHRNRRYCFTVNPNYILENQSASSQPIQPQLRSSSDNIKRYPNTNRIYLISAQTVFDQNKWIEMIKLAINSDDNKSNLKKANQLEKVKDLVRRKESLPMHPSLLNRTIQTESLNDNIKVQLSKKKFYFYHDNLTLPSLSYIDSDIPLDLQEIHHQHLVILQQQKEEINKKLKHLELKQSSSNSQSSSNAASANNSNKVSPAISPLSSSPLSTSPSKYSTSPLSTSPRNKFTNMFSTSPSKSPPHRPSSPTNINSNDSPFYGAPITRLPLLSTSVTGNSIGLISNGTPIISTMNASIASSANALNQNKNRSFSLSSSPSIAYNQLVSVSNQVNHRHQPKIVVYHLVRDSFQIQNIGNCSFNFEILPPFDQNYTINFIPSNGIVQKGESLTVLVELMAYNHIETDIYSTLHIVGGMEFTLFCRVETDPYLPLFLKSCAGSLLSPDNQKRMDYFIRNHPNMLKPIQELAHTMIQEGRNIPPIQVAPNNSGWNILSKPQNQHLQHNLMMMNQMSNPSLSSSNSSTSSNSRVRLSKYVLNYQRNHKKASREGVKEAVKIYQLLTDKFLISNSGSADASFQFNFPSRGKKNNQFSLTLVPTNGTVAKGEWFYIKSTLTVFVETEISEVIQLVINQKEIHYILVTVKCENLHPGNKEIDIDQEIVLQDRLGTGATGDIYKGLISQENLNRHVNIDLSDILSSQNHNNTGQNWLIARNPSNDSIKNNNNSSTQIIVAVKKLHPLTDPSPEMIQDFYNEVRVLSMFNHPNIVKYVGGCTKIGNWSIVMEYVPGGNLMDVLANPVLVIPYKLILRMALDIAKGLHYLHSLGILHLDLKSPNLLVSSLSTNSKVNIKVADFNTCINRNRITGFFKPSVLLSKDSNSDLKEDSKKGTTLWMAPEVIKGALYSEKCDVYSFGIIMWEMVTRKLPYSHISFNCEVEDQVIKGLRPPIPMHCNKVYTDLMEECWNDDPEKRPFFDTIIHRLNKMIESNTIQEQKVKASFKGLRRTQSNSALNLIGNTSNNSDPNTLLNNNFDSPPLILTQDQNLLLNLNINNNRNSNSNSNNNNNNNYTTSTDTTTSISTNITTTTTTTTTTTNKNNNNHKGTITTAPQFEGEFVHSKHKSKRFSFDGSSVHSSILTINNDSNLPFKFSPPSTPQGSFLQLKKLDKELKENLENSKKHSFIRYRPSFTNVSVLKNNISPNNSNNQL